MIWVICCFILSGCWMDSSCGVVVEIPEVPTEFDGVGVLSYPGLDGSNLVHLKSEAGVGVEILLPREEVVPILWEGPAGLVASGALWPSDRCGRKRITLSWSRGPAVSVLTDLVESGGLPGRIDWQSFDERARETEEWGWSLDRKLLKRHLRMGMYYRSSFRRQTLYDGPGPPDTEGLWVWNDLSSGFGEDRWCRSPGIWEMRSGKCRRVLVVTDEEWKWLDPNNRVLSSGEVREAVSE